MSEKFLSPREIERWIPRSLRYVLGCSEIKNHFSKMLAAGATGLNIIITGPALTGKTVSAMAYLRTLMCRNRHYSGLDVCGRCKSCRRFEPRFPSVSGGPYALR